mgnify:CR=1 FL=1
MTRVQTLSLAIGVALAALTVGWMAGRATQGASSASTSADAPTERKVLYYRNPMGLADTSPVPKKDSMGMDYLPVYEGGEAPAAPGTVVLSPEKVQKLGVRTEAVRAQALSPSIRASATVQVDETRQYAIAPKFEGWVEQLRANQTGMAVRRGQPLLSVYSPELLAARNEYRVADDAARKLAAGDAASAATMTRLRDAARQRLKNWGIDTTQPANGAHGDAGSLVIRSPADAVLIEKPIVQGDRFAAGDTILRLADLSTVWLIANVPATSAGLVSVGQQARFQSPALPGRNFEGQVAFIQPVIDPQTRTLAVRVALPNPDGSLRPGLFGDVVLSRDSAGEALTVARSAVLDSGVRRVVLVQVGEGRFEPRDVVLGERSGDRVEVREGLHAGERVVVSANFLIDAESNLQAALESLTSSHDHALDNHAGHEHDAADTGSDPSVPGAAESAPSHDHHQHETPPAFEPNHSDHTDSTSSGVTPKPAADADTSHDSHAMEH